MLKKQTFKNIPLVWLFKVYIDENNPHLTTYKCTNKKRTTNVKPSNKKNKNKAHFFQST